MAVRDDWAPGEVLTSTDLNDTFAAKQDSSSTGLVHIASGSFSAASSVPVDDVFTSTYRNYRVVVEGTGSSTTNLVLVRCYLRDTSNADITTANYQNMVLQLNQASGPTRFWNPGLTYTDISSAGNLGFTFSADFFTPQLASATHIYGNFQGASSTAFQMGLQVTSFTANTVAEGFRLSVSSGTITGSYRVYGYKD